MNYKGIYQNIKSKKIITILLALIITFGIIIYAYAVNDITGNEVTNEKQLIKMGASISMGEDPNTTITRNALAAQLDRYLGAGKATVTTISGQNALKITYLETGREYTINMDTGYMGTEKVLTFNANGGSVSPSSKEIIYGMVYGELPIPTREGYEFNGWWTDLNGGVQITETDTCGFTGDGVVYAKWTANVYTLTYNVNGGNSISPSSKTITYGETYGTLPTPTRTNYIFLGWYTGADTGTKVTSDTIYTIPGDSIIYARWTTGLWNYGYTGSYQTWTATETGYYDIVLNGASGGISVYSVNQIGSYPTLSSAGGRVNMRIYAQAGAVLYISVGGGGGSGGKFNADTSTSYGGWNGGGAGGIGPFLSEKSWMSKYAAGGGGGCTHIASSLNKTDGQLKSYGSASTAQNYVLGVAGGGGASNHGRISYDTGRDSRGGETGYLSGIFGQGENGADFSGYTNTQNVPSDVEGTGGGGRRLVWRSFL